MKKPAIISFLKSIYFKKINSLSQRDALLLEKLGAQKYDMLCDLIEARYGSECNHDRDNLARDEQNLAFYSFKNQDYFTSMAISNAFDGNFYISVGEWLEWVKDYFGATILDVGCDCGILTCFIATLLPQAKVVGIDQNESAIVIAKALAEKLKLTNVSFEVAAMSEMPSGQFETIFTSRTAHENGDYDKVGKLPEEDQFEEIAERVAPFYQSYANQLSSLMGEKANLIKISRETMGARYLARLLAFNRAGIQWVPEVCFPDKVTLDEKLNATEEFQYAVFEKGDSVDDLPEQYLDFFFDPEGGAFSEMKHDYFDGSLAKVYFAYHKGIPNFGFEVFSGDGRRITKFMCYTGKHQQHFLNMMCEDGRFIVYKVLEQQLDSAREHLRSDMSKNWLQKPDVVIKPLNL